MLKIIHILLCWKEMVCFEYALFVKYGIYIKSLMVWCFCCHGNMNRDNSFVNLILVLKTRCWLHNMYINNNQSYPLFRRDILLWISSFFAKSLTIWWFCCHGNLYLNNFIIFNFLILFIRCGLARMCINYQYFCLHKQDNLLWNCSIL